MRETKPKMQSHQSTICSLHCNARLISALKFIGKLIVLLAFSAQCRDFVYISPQNKTSHDHATREMGKLINHCIRMYCKYACVC